RPNDPLLLASLSVLFRQYGDYGAAKKVLALLEGRFGEVGWLLRERGTIEYLLGESAAAEDLLDRARESGASSPELLFMLSKVKFDLLKTEESQEVFSEARESDPARVNELERLEQLYGEKNELGLPKSIFPAQLYFDSAIEPLPQAWEQQSRRSQLLLRGMGAPQIASMGVVLMLMFLISPWLFSADREVYYLKNRDGVRFVSLLPGGLLVAAGRPIISWFFTTFFAVTLFVVFGWPNGVASFFSHHPEVTGWATGALLLVLASSYVLGWLFFQREEI
ncbi:MAG: hypothetical protein KDD60_07590, partial [Bdellovibrionales bacterium]|nr:hypothetical protein [Bdellovibrionales bacterium]